jgi:hypothetical protein
VSLITPLITYARNGHLVPALVAEMLASSAKPAAFGLRRTSQTALYRPITCRDDVADPWMLGLCGPIVPWSIPLAVRR